MRSAAPASAAASTRRAWSFLAWRSWPIIHFWNSSDGRKGGRNLEERPMQGHDVDRRLFLGASAATLLGAAGAAHAQAPQAPQAAKASDAGAKPTARVVDFIVGFDPRQVPALAVERA